MTTLWNSIAGYLAAQAPQNTKQVATAGLAAVFGAWRTTTNLVD